ncbi:MAG: cyclic nucleotide-binding domain-containing protein [Rubritepida sp.]|jgi:CRP-like cAMP-binding protein|nr:cyclic nucleotide-binding domain-containing protein [Rubritepida sp.]
MSATTSITDLALQDYRDVARHAGQVRALAPGEALFHEGEAAAEMHVLLNGGIEVRARGTVIETVRPGDGLGILSLIDGRPRSATAVAVEPSEVAVLDARKFRFLVESTPGFVWFVMGEMAQRLRATNAAL